MMKLSMIKVRNIFKALAMLVACLAMDSCSNHQDLPANIDGYNNADSIVSGIGDARDFNRLIAVTDSFERAGDLPPVRAIFYKTIAYNLMGQHRAALHLYYQLAKISAKDLKTQADIDSYTYSAKDYVRLLCDMRRYDRALREAYNADRKLKEAGQDSFVDNHEIAQMIGALCRQVSFIRTLCIVRTSLYLGQQRLAVVDFCLHLIDIHGVAVRMLVGNDKQRVLTGYPGSNLVVAASLCQRFGNGVHRLLTQAQLQRTGVRGQTGLHNL